MFICRMLEMYIYLFFYMDSFARQPLASEEQATSKLGDLLKVNIRYQF